jgi:phage tail tape-measure protein
MAEGIDFAITAHDRASTILANVSRASSAMTKNVSSGFRQMADDIKKESQKAQNSTASLGKTMGSFLAGGAIVGGVLALGKAFISANSNMETFNLQFETLLGSSEEAKKRMEELAKFAAATPFELDGIAKASKLLQTYGGTALAVGDNLKMVGDAAAVAGVGIEDLAFWVGRAYAGLSNNESIGEALNRFTEMAVVGAKAKREINALIEQGDGMGAWKVLQEELNKSAGAMEKLSNSWVGVVSTIKDQFAEINRAIGDAGIWAELKAGIMTVRDELQKWIDSGGMKEMAKNISGFIKVLWDLKEPIMWMVGGFGISLIATQIDRKSVV